MVRNTGRRTRALGLLGKGGSTFGSGQLRGPLIVALIGCLTLTASSVAVADPGSDYIVDERVCDVIAAGANEPDRSATWGVKMATLALADIWNVKPEVAFYGVIGAVDDYCPRYKPAVYAFSVSMKSPYFQWS